MIVPPKNIRVFVRRSEIPTTMIRMIDFHSKAGTLKKLTPPPIFVQIRRDDRITMTEGEVDFTLWFGPIPVRWIARHEPGPIDTSFIDRMIRGPMAYWQHEHIFEAVPDGVALTDRLTFAHKKGLQGILTLLLFDGIPLRILFFYRHWRTRLALK